MNIHGYPSNSMDIQRFPCILMNFHGYAWKVHTTDGPSDRLTHAAKSCCHICFLISSSVKIPSSLELLRTFAFQFHYTFRFQHPMEIRNYSAYMYARLS